MAESLIYTDKYKYRPEDFEHIPLMRNDLEDFYQSLEGYLVNQTSESLYFLENRLQTLLFTIKHRKLEGFLTAITASDLEIYIGGLMDECND